MVIDMPDELTQVRQNVVSDKNKSLKIIEAHWCGIINAYAEEVNRIKSQNTFIRTIIAFIWLVWLEVTILNGL